MGYNKTMMTKDVTLGKNVSIPHPELVNLFGCTIGDNTKIAAFVEIKKGVVVGKNCKIEPFVFIPEGVIIEDRVFIGPNVTFTNDKHPKATNPDGSLIDFCEWKKYRTVIKKGASVGAGTVILPGVTVGANAMVGAGAVVTRDVPADETVIGNPARQVDK